MKEELITRWLKEKKPVLGYMLLTILFIALWIILFGEDTSPDLSRCIDVSKEYKNDLETFLDIDSWVTLGNLQAVKSNDYSKVYFISGYLEWPGITENKSIATFWSNSITVWEGLKWSVNGLAQEFSVLHEFKEVSMSGDGAQLSQTCVKNK